MDKVIKTCHDINDDAEMWRLLDEDHARRNIGVEKEAIAEKAMAKGLEEGSKTKAIEVAKNAKQMNLKVEDIIKLTGLSKEEIESL